MASPPKSFGAGDMIKVVRDLGIVVVAAVLTFLIEKGLPELADEWEWMTPTLLAGLVAVLSAIRRWVQDTTIEGPLYYGKKKE